MHILASANALYLPIWHRAPDTVVFCLQVLANILANAVKFTPSGEVVIHASCKPATLEGINGENAGKQLLRVSIRDTGIGISEESMKKLFQCFRQGSESMSRNYGGTGVLLPRNALITRRLYAMLCP